MSHSPDDVKHCPTLGHSYISVTVMRCPHREGYTATARVWQDSDDDEPVVLFEDHTWFGPFDDRVAICKRVSELAWAAAMVLTVP